MSCATGHVSAYRSCMRAARCVRVQGLGTEVATWVSSVVLLASLDGRLRLGVARCGVLELGLGGRGASWMATMGWI